MEISFTQAVMEVPADEYYYVPAKTKAEIMAPRVALMILKAMVVIFVLGLLVSDAAFLVPVLLLVVAMITYRTMAKETTK